MFGKQLLVWKSNNKDKLKAYQRKWRKSNTDYINKYRKEYYIKNKDKVKAQGLKWQLRNPGYQYHKSRNVLFVILGNMCVKCGLNDIRILQFDHINGGGNVEQKKYRNNYHMYRYYVKHPDEAIKNLQVLCPNCNAIKRVELREFPKKIKVGG